MNVLNKTRMIYDGCRRVAVLWIMLLSVGTLHAQEESVVVSDEARNFFNSMSIKRDTAEIRRISRWQRDRFMKRFSLHTNLLDWVTLVPNIGIEVDIKQTPRNNWSVLAFGKYNGKQPHKEIHSGANNTVLSHGGVRYDVSGIRLEGRHYWRTGKFGKKIPYHDDYVKLNTNIHDTLGYNADSLSHWWYNHYHKVRRNVFSSRTLNNPRNWRAYYLGAWAAYENWNLAMFGKGRIGHGMGAGILAGWSVPLLPQRYPKEGSLDLDIGIHVGVKAVKYDRWTWEDSTRTCILDPSKSQNTWKIVPFPVVQDVHVSLVWRFRSIKNKVDRSLIDDYEKKLEKFQNRMDYLQNKKDSIRTRNKFVKDSLQVRNAFLADSTVYWDQFNKRRLENAMLINPDTVFTGSNLNLYLKIIKGIDPTEKNLKKRNKEEAKKQKLEAEEQKKALKQEKKKKSVQQKDK